MSGQLPTLLFADNTTQQYWVRDFLHEAANALRAHLEVYAKFSSDIQGGNPGRWDIESAWGALQTIVNELAARTLGLLLPVPRVHKDENVFLLQKVLADYLSLSKEIPLVKDGYTTNNDAAQYARVLTKMLETCTLLLSPGAPPPKQVYDRWRTNKFR